MTIIHKRYPKNAIERARDGALEWLRGNADGYPRSFEQEMLHDKRRGYVMYEDFEAPPIVGYEALEREGIAIRMETSITRSQERVHFRLAPGQAVAVDAATKT